jgi:uncharacterized protein
MKIILKKKPKNPTIIEAFPGFGLVGTIAAEFLIDHLKTELIGTIWFEEMPAMTAIHNEKIVQPMGIFYNKKYNIVIIHVITNAQGVEWKISDVLLDLAKQLKAKEIISLEGVGSPTGAGQSKAFYYSNNEKNKAKLKNIGIGPLKEGIVMGVTSALMLKVGNIVPMSCIFAETHSQLPDSKAAAKVIETLDKYLNLKVDPQPLLKTAEKFEAKLKGMLSESGKMKTEQDKKQLSYVG